MHGGSAEMLGYTSPKHFAAYVIIPTDLASYFLLFRLIFQEIVSFCGQQQKWSYCQAEKLSNVILLKSCCLQDLKLLVILHAQTW